jgi:hypothetical protein
MAALLQVDFLPPPFSGDTINHNKCRAHFLSFIDYLHAHDLGAPADAAAVAHVVSLFRLTLVDDARLWI